MTTTHNADCQAEVKTTSIIEAGFSFRFNPTFEYVPNARFGIHGDPRVIEARQIDCETFSAVQIVFESYGGRDKTEVTIFDTTLVELAKQILDNLNG